MKLWFYFLFSTTVYCQMASISDIVYATVGGERWQGKIVVTLNSPESAQPLLVGAVPLAGWTQTLCLGVTGSDCSIQLGPGVVRINLYPNVGAGAITPEGTSYSARYEPRNNASQKYFELWVVSQSNTLLSEIRSNTVPSPRMMIQPNQIVTTGGSEGQCMAKISGVAAWTTCATSSVNEYTGSLALDLPSIPDGTCHLSTTAITVMNASAGHRTVVGLSTALPEGITPSAVVSGPNLMKVQLCNNSGAAYDPPSITYTLGAIT